jgi:hypothetical protein
MRRFRRLADGLVQLRLPQTEQEVLASVLPQLRVVLDGGADVAHLRGRLFPPAYDDPELERQFRELVADDLVAQRRAALDQVLTSLEGGRVRGRAWIVHLDDDQVQAWLAVLHDLRLVLAQVIGIETEADWSRDPKQAEPTELLLWHVGALQEDLLDVLLHGLDSG